MNFWETLTLGGTMAMILGVFPTVYGIINNRTLKEESRATREILSRIEQGQNETRREIGGALAEARKDMAESLRYLADLVRQEGDKTRQAVRAS
ncbi:MAG: hypothetical protein A3H94_05620 [Acidobacteria bacterium RIFCSPLOWO2_02_FULL_60_20]|nr:MAG: hypothetical protein A3H94_05620 [Acidobacteria bacterium RIFCSPLOWO2_02_FULL_60_20]